MISKQQAILLTAVVTVVAMTIGTSGASSVSAERGVDMAVAADRAAVVGFEQTALDTDDGTTDLELTVRNQFVSGTELTTVELSVDGTTRDVAADPLEPGADTTATFSGVSCAKEVSVHVSGPDLDTRFRRPVRC